MGKRNIQSHIVRRSSHRIPPARKKSKDPKPLRQWFFVIMVLIFCGVSVYVVTCSPIMSMHTIIVSGAQRVDGSQIESTVRSLLEGQLFGCIGNDNYLFFPKDRLRELILSDVRVESVRIKRIFPDTLVIDIQEYHHITVLCTDADTRCFHIVDGCVIASVDLRDTLIEQNPHTIIRGEQYGEMAVGECIMSAEDMHALLYLGQELKYVLDVNIVPPYVSSIRGSREARYDTDEGWYILADLSYDPKDTVTAAHLFDKKVSLPSVRSDLAYIDLRFPERIFYKMKDGVIIEDDENAAIDDDSNDEKIKDTHD